MKDITQLPQDILILVNKFQEHHPNMLNIMGKDAVEETLNVFKDEAFDGKTWPARKVPDAGRNLLVQSGTMRRAVTYQVAAKILQVGLDLRKVPYAQAHNDGYNGKTKQHVRAHKRAGRSVKAHTRQANITIPQRQFLGVTPRLIKKWELSIRNYAQRHIFNT